MPPTSKVELVRAIRRDAAEGLFQRALERKYGVGRQTVASGWPEPCKPLPPKPSRLDPFKPVVDGMLRADLGAPRMRRHTAKRIFDRLVDEHGMANVSYQVVRGYVAASLSFRDKLILGGVFADQGPFFMITSVLPTSTMRGERITAGYRVAVVAARPHAPPLMIMGSRACG